MEAQHSKTSNPLAAFCNGSKGCTMTDKHGQVLSVIECKNAACGHKMSRVGYPDDWPDEYVSDDRIHSDWNEELTEFCICCVRCGHYTGNKIVKGRKPREEY